MKRLVTGLFMAILAIAIVEFAPSPLVWAAIAVLALLMVEEARRILARLGKAPWVAIAFAGTLAVLAAFAWDGGGLPVAGIVAAVLLCAFLRAFVPTQEPAAGVDRVLGTLMTVCYVGVLMGHVVGLFPLAHARADVYSHLCILLLGAVYFGDTFALYGGKTFGRHKMAPGISPSKTWEGAAFSVLGSLVFAFLAYALLLKDLLPLVDVVVLAIAMGLVGIAGDLAESLFKRAAALKDSGALLPGHGGMLDRADSLLFAAPVLYWYERLLLAGRLLH